MRKSQLVLDQLSSCTVTITILCIVNKVGDESFVNFDVLIRVGVSPVRMIPASLILFLSHYLDKAPLISIKENEDCPSIVDFSLLVFEGLNRSFIDNNDVVHVRGLEKWKEVVSIPIRYPQSPSLSAVLDEITAALKSKGDLRVNNTQDPSSMIPFSDSVPYDSITLKRLVGKGSFSRVYEAYSSSLWNEH